MHHEVLLALLAEKFQQVLGIHPAFARVLGEQDEIVEVLQRNLPALADQLLLDELPEDFQLDWLLDPPGGTE